MDLRVLGDVRICTDDRIVDLARSGERCVLATLAFNPGRPVQLYTLAENIWGDRLPAKAEQTVTSYVRAVRRAIEDAGGSRDWLCNRRPRSYELRIAPAIVDYHRFTALADEGRTEAHRGDRAGAVVAYQRALALWLADPLANVTGDWAERRRYTLRQELLDILCALFEQQLELGNFVAVATRATEMLDEFVPTDRLVALAIRGLAGCGRQAHIPEFVDRAARRMWSAVQVRPGPNIHALVQRLVAEPSVSAVDSPRVTHRSAATVELAAADPEPETENLVDTSAGDALHWSLPGRETDAADSRISMTASFNNRVYQAAGDQHIVEP